jgi:hypothetical protein
MVEGAVYKPFELTVPHAAPVHPAPLSDHVTPRFVLPVTVARNCLCSPTANTTVVGEIVTDTGVTTLIRAEADFVVSACDVALMTTSAGLGITDGAV